MLLVSSCQCSFHVLQTFTIDDVLVSDRVKTGLSSKLVDVNRLKIDIHRIRVDRFLGKLGF